MSRREDAKEFNRARIRAAAEAIIRAEGIGSLTMRRLAERAEVSLRTPYNLFGSKTDVLIALLDEAQLQLTPLGDVAGQGSALDQSLDALMRIEAFFASDEEYYRGIYHAIMTSDHPEAREARVARAITTTQWLMARAVERGELAAQTNSAALGRHLAIQLLAVLGMWGSGFFSNRQSIAQVRRGWLAELLQHCSEDMRPSLAAAYRKWDDTQGETDEA
ncbi:MAG: TetR/AcrR family transcriptional regulator [Proteobacteria bacterium]|nr:TetR/AcrR family transcriptional regulator [Pseudomonadota bacterium]MDA1033845.1 TetR/AcrR family transcriptional regulator [Pseudomonadota bacterium]